MKPKPPAQPKRSPALQELISELWLIKRLGCHGTHIDTGLTTPEIRRKRIREAIQWVGPQVIAGRNSTGKSLTYAEVWTQLYGGPFEQPGQDIAHESF